MRSLLNTTPIGLAAAVFVVVILPLVAAVADSVLAVSP